MMFNLKIMHLRFRVRIETDICMHEVDLIVAPRSYPLQLLSLPVL